MSYCTNIKTYEGTKSQRLLGMISDKLRDKEKKNLKKLSADVKLNRYHKLLVKFTAEAKKYSDLLTERKESLGISWNSGYGEKKGEYMISSAMCRVPIQDQANLQKASDLFSIGKHKEANKLWDKLMKKYKIGEMC